MIRASKSLFYVNLICTQFKAWISNVQGRYLESRKTQEMDPNESLIFAVWFPFVHGIRLLNHLWTTTSEARCLRPTLSWFPASVLTSTGIMGFLRRYFGWFVTSAHASMKGIRGLCKFNQRAVAATTSSSVASSSLLASHVPNTRLRTLKSPWTVSFGITLWFLFLECYPYAVGQTDSEFLGNAKVLNWRSHG